MTTTTLTYLDDPYQLQAEATVVGSETREDGQQVLFLDHTIFYPQGGGQPFDFGFIHTPSLDFRVEEVRFIDGIVHHIGVLLGGAIPSAGTTVGLKVDEERRKMHCKIHTAGHLVDVAMLKAGFEFRPSKGYHFADSPYVEYVGVIPAEEREAAKANLDEQLKALIAANTPVHWRIVGSREDLLEDCKFIPDYLPEGKPIRVVNVAGLGCPCGGTHVKELSELGHVSIKKIKSKKGFTRVTYQLQ